jgi:hypothetical protein
MSLSLTDFLNYSGYSANQVNTNYLNYLLSSIENEILDEIGTLFSLTQIDDNSVSPIPKFVDYSGNNTDIVSVGAWQENGLVVKIGVRGMSGFQLRTLTKNIDYEVKYYADRFLPNQPNPVVKIRLLRNYTGVVGPSMYSIYGQHGNQIGALNTSPKLFLNQFLRLTGTFGWSTTWPADLKNLLYNTIKNKYEWNNQQTKNQGGGITTLERSITLEKQNQLTPEVMNSQKSLAMNILAEPEVRAKIAKYKQYISKNVVIS